MSGDLAAGGADAARLNPVAAEFQSTAFRDIYAHCENTLQGMASATAGPFPIEQARDQLQIIQRLPSVSHFAAASQFVAALISTVEMAPVSPVGKIDISLWIKRALVLAKQSVDPMPAAPPFRPDNPFKPQIPKSKKTHFSQRRPVKPQCNSSSETPNRNIF